MYQARRVPFCNTDNYNDKRASRAQEKVKNRRLSRQKKYDTNRNIAADLELTGSHEIIGTPEKLSRRDQLIRWKQKKELSKKAELEKKAKDKPPFKCGLVHHKPPPILDTGYRRSMRIQNMKNPVKEVNVAIATSLNIIGRKRNHHPPSSNRTFQSFAPASHQFKAPKNLPKVEENGLSQIVDPEEQVTDFSNASKFSFPAQLSPWITKSRGSDGGKVSPSFKGRNESPCSNKKMLSPLKIPEYGKGTPDDLRRLVGKRLIQQYLRTPEIEKEEKRVSPRGNTPALSKENVESLQNFRSLYEGEMDRLDRLCSEWDSLLSSEACQEISEEVQNTILATVGQTRLLMREKLAQFNDLLSKFKVKSSKSFEVITCSDLQGFWDLVSIQVNDVDTKFTSLNTLKWNNWIKVEEPKKIPEKAIAGRKGRNKRVSKAKNPNTAKSAFKAYIAEQRKKNEAKENVAIICNETVKSDAVLEEKTNSILSSSPILEINLLKTPTTILKRRSSRKLSFKMEGERVTPKRSSRKVTFADTPPEDFTVMPRVKVCGTPIPHIRHSRGADNKPTLLSLNSPIFASAQGDLINWESPIKDYLPVGRRQSPRLSSHKNKSFL